MTNPIWKFDPAHSSVTSKVRHMMFAKVHGRFASWQGDVAFDPEAPDNSRVDVRIAVESIETGVADRDTHLRSADFFDAESFPEIRFSTSSFEKLNAETYRLTGELTIRDITRELSFDAHYHGSGRDPWGNERVGFGATTRVNRKDFGLTWNQVLETGGVMVGEDIAIEIDAQLIKQAT